MDTARQLAAASPATPQSEYTQRLAAFRDLRVVQDRREQAVGTGRVVVFLTGAVLLVLVLFMGYLSPWWLLLPVVMFIGLVGLHGRVLRAGIRAKHGAAFYERSLARLEGRWAGTGQAGDRFRDEAHPYALDLDLFGKGSLFELLSTARLRAGENTLAAWLMAPATAAEVRARQAAVAELRPRLDLREGLALLATGVPAGVDLAGLVSWATAPQMQVPRGTRTTALILSALALVALIGWATLPISASPLMVVLIVEIFFTLWMAPRVRQVLAPVERRARDLALFAGVLARLERESFTDPLLCRLQQGLYSEGHPPSEQIARLVRLIDLLNSPRNQLFAPVAFALLWHVHMAFRMEDWRKTTGAAVARWMAGVGDFEALCALAAYAYENPADPFPEVIDEGPCFEGEGMGHPLLPGGGVRNDLRLGDPLRLLVVSGSNMSGKSTFLRTIGVNAVLAQAGAPVRAQRLRLSPLAVGSTLRVEDSLQAGRSRFYAEVTRIRQLVDLARGTRPLLFLLDELFHGTNSHDRKIGAEGVLRSLIDQGAIGLITTHDLSLSAVADQLAPRAANAHFADHFEHGKMVFDYTLRPGVVQGSNALALMRAVGLDV